MMAKLAAYDRAVSVVLKGAMDQCQKALVRVVHEELSKVQRQSHPSRTERFIDGVENRPIEQIEPFGHAFFRFSYWEEIVVFALEVLTATSPVDSGDYKSQHSLYADDALVGSPAQIGNASRVVIANTVPYARRLEIPSKWWFKNSGKKGAPRGWSVQSQVPQPKDSIYHHAAMTVRRKYGNVVNVSYTWVEGEGASGRFPAILLTGA
jgi:hypothetical protein